MVELGAQEPDFSLLTQREREVVSALLDGYTSDREIAYHMCVSIHTVQSHLRSIFDKLQVNGRVTLALAAERSGLFAKSEKNS